MNIQKFINDLKVLLENTTKSNPEPDQEVLLSTSSFSTCNYGVEILRLGLDCFEGEEVYCEIGCHQGDNLVRVLQDNPEVMTYAVDDYKEFDVLEKAAEVLVERLEKANIHNQICFCQQSGEEFFHALAEINSIDKIGILYVSNPQSSDQLLRELSLSKPFLANKSIILIGNTNWQEIKYTTGQFFQIHFGIKPLVDLASKYYGHPNYGNGLQIFVRNQEDTQITFTFKSQKSAFEESAQDNLKVEQLFREALSKDIAGYSNAAEQQYRQILACDQDHFQSWYNLGMICYGNNKLDMALGMLAKSNSLDPNKAITWYGIAQVFEKLDDLTRTIYAYQNVTKFDSKHINALNNLGNIYLHIGQLKQAEDLYRQAIKGNPNHFGNYLNLGNVQLKQNDIDQAIVSFKQSLDLEPRHPAILYGIGSAYTFKGEHIQASIYLGYSYYYAGEYNKAIQEFFKVIKVTTPDEHFYVSFADCYELDNRYEDAVRIYCQGIEQYPDSFRLYFYLMKCLQALGKVSEAIALSNKAVQRFPNNFFFKYRAKLMLPILYSSTEEIERYRDDYIKFSHQIYEEVLSNNVLSEDLVSLINYDTNFYLQYQGKNDLELQIHYGQVIQHLLHRMYPQWSFPRAMPPISEQKKIRVGYISPSMYGHTVAKLSIGWLQSHSSDKFEVYAYSLASKYDNYSQLFDINSYKFCQLPQELEVVCRKVIADDLHVLVFFDIGMSPIMSQLAALRLAPIQCATWGHPITSGLKSVDFFLSSELMEPKNGAEHYSEELICLPNIGFSYNKPEIPEQTLERSDFKLRSDAIVYLSCQSLFKYLPQYDWVFPAIANHIPQAQFAFLSHPSVHVTNLFRQRLEEAFTKNDLNYQDYCVVLPRMDVVKYWNLNLLSDIFLDTFSWSGGNTTLEAIACNLPIVTCPGEFMRGRHSYGILKMIDVTETIANSETEYVEIAVRLGLDPQWRQQVITKMRSRHSQLYEDKTSVRALEAFYQRVVHERLAKATEYSR